MTPSLVGKASGLSTQEVQFEIRAFQGIYVVFIISSANAVSDGDKESECDEDGPSPEDSRKVNVTFWNPLRKEYIKCTSCFKMNQHWFAKHALYLFFGLIFPTGNNGGNTLPSRGPFWPLSLQRWRER